MNHVLGIDAGGTKTVCLLADETGTVIGEGRGEGANLSTGGAERVESVLRRVIAEAIGDSLIVPSAVCLGVAGAARPSDASILREIMGRVIPSARVVVSNDALIALAAGAGDGPGIVIISGTGSIVYGRDHRDRTARAGGWGHILGDEGSGYWIGRHALAAVMRAGDGRGPATALTPQIFSHFGVDSLGALDHAIYLGPTPPSAIASLGGLVERTRAAGDAVARDILEHAADELVAGARSVVERLGLATEVFTFVLAGGMFHAVPWLTGELQRRLPHLAPRADVRRLDAQPATGAVRLALRELARG